MQCISLPKISYRKFSDGIYKKVLSRRIPVEGTLELTLRCNLRCVHCYAVCDPHNKELTYEEICHILDQISEAGCFWLLLTGGEPLLRDDFLDIYIYAKEKGFLVTLFTNGTLVTPEIVHCFQKLPPFMVEITLNGITKQTYERINGVQASFERCLRGIHLFLDHGIPLRLKTVAMNVNKNELWEIKGYVEGLGLKFGFDPMICPRIDGSRGPCTVRLSPQEVVELEMEDETYRREWQRLYEKFWGADKSGYLYNCGAGLSSFHIDPYGHLSPCLISRPLGHDLRRESFQEAWDAFLPQIYGRWSTDSECRSCKSSLCDNCPGWAQLEENNPEAPVKYLCQVAHLRAQYLAGKRKERG